MPIMMASQIQSKVIQQVVQIPIVTVRQTMLIRTLIMTVFQTLSKVIPQVVQTQIVMVPLIT